MSLDATLAVPWLSAATTLHLAFAVLVNHFYQGARAFTPLALVPLAIGATPWLFPTGAGLLASVVAELAWVGICSRLTPAAPPPAAPAKPPARSAAAPVRPAARASDAARPKGFVQTPILSVIAESPDIKTFRLARPEGFEFTPGQFLTVRLRSDGKDVVRCYSLSSAPAARGYLEISIRKQGRVSNALHALARPGSVLSVRAPAGAFTYPGGDDRPLVLFGGGIGITPLMSMLRHALLTEPTRPVTLLYSAKEMGEFAFRDELLTLTRRHDQLQVCFAVTRGVAPPDVYKGRIDEKLVLSSVPEIREAVSMICGPQGMIDGVTAMLVGLGVPADQVRSERFEAAVAASAGAAKTEAAEPAASGEAFQIRERRTSKAVSAASGQTLLDAADAQGLEIPSLCRAGVCGTCRTKVVEGDVSCDGGILDADDRAAGYVLACVASPRSHCVIEVS
ncbi:MAG: iron-sulfur cluster-binding domain-containing protein [Vicinamibacterales bacterium]